MNKYTMNMVEQVSLGMLEYPLVKCLRVAQLGLDVD